jgi:CMP-N,N'-diacetyllegionaminic acid synthase
MSIIGIIPARKGSKRVPGKNTKLLAGKPLIEYAIDACAGSKLLDSIIVSSNDEAIEKIVGQYPEIKFDKRPEELSTDTSPAIDCVHHILKNFFSDALPEIVVIVQATTPFVTSDDIDATIGMLKNDPTADTAVSVVKVEQLYHPYKLKTMDGNKLLPYLVDEKGKMAAHELPDVYVRNGAVYASRLLVINKNLIIGDHCLAHVMPYERSVDINYPIDFEFAEFLAKKYHSLS